MSVATSQHFDGGGKRDRTDDLLHAMQALSQLSYTPYAKFLQISVKVFPVALQG
jgi:hypothetical protein